MGLSPGKKKKSITSSTTIDLLVPWNQTLRQLLQETGLTLGSTKEDGNSFGPKSTANLIYWSQDLTPLFMSSPQFVVELSAERLEAVAEENITSNQQSKSVEKEVESLAAGRRILTS